MPPATEVQRHAVIFDVNVYLDIAHHLGSPFSWAAFDAVSARSFKQRVPHPEHPALDSLRAVAACTSGRFAGNEPIEVWTNTHITDLVEYKAVSALGWPVKDAEDLVENLVNGLIERSNGGTLGTSHYPDGNPPLDHEDGMVYGACKKLSGEDPLAAVYCVTRDRGFLEAYRTGKLTNHSRVLAPAQILAAMMAARRNLSTPRPR